MLTSEMSFGVLFTICGEMKQFKILVQYKYSNETTLSLSTHPYYCHRRKTRCVIFLTKTCFHYVKNLLFSLKFVLERILHIAVIYTYFFVFNISLYLFHHYLTLYCLLLVANIMRFGIKDG